MPATDWRSLTPGDGFHHGGDGLTGTVVVTLETGAAHPAHGATGWGEGCGLVVRTIRAGLVHDPADTLDPDDDGTGG